jgi:hypothetical protein
LVFAINQDRMSREYEHPRYLPKVNRDYDPVIKTWTHPPPRWLWIYTAEPAKTTKLDTICGIVGVLILGVLILGAFIALVLL